MIKIKNSRRIALLAATPLLAGGLGLLVASGGGVAQAAGTPGGATSAQVNVGQSLTLTDNTAILSFGTATPGQAANGSVSLSASSNDSKGFSVTVTPASSASNGADFVGQTSASDTIPIGALADTPSAGSASGQSEVLAAGANNINTFPAAGPQAWSDAYTLNVPAAASPDSYATTLGYTATAR